MQRISILYVLPYVLFGGVAWALETFPGQKSVSRLVRPAGCETLSYKEAEDACLKLHGTLPLVGDDCSSKFVGAQAENAFNGPATLWVFKGYPGNKAELTDDTYHTCNALNTTDQSVSQTLGDNLYTVDQAEAECVTQSSHLASVHSEEENHAIRLLIGDRYPFKKCVRLGMTYSVQGFQTHSADKVFDGTAFDFGNHPCGGNGSYPWCGGEPDCFGGLEDTPKRQGTTVVMYSLFGGGHRCWDDLAGDESSKCSAVCKRKMH